MKPALILLALTLTLTATIAPHHCAAKPKEISIDSGSLFEGPTRPLEDILRAIKKHPQARLIRVNWNSSATLAVDYAVILYDRQHHTLKYYRWEDSFVSDNDGKDLQTRQQSSIPAFKTR